MENYEIVGLILELNTNSKSNAFPKMASVLFESGGNYYAQVNKINLYNETKKLEMSTDAEYYHVATKENFEKFILPRKWFVKLNEVAHNLEYLNKQKVIYALQLSNKEFIIDNFENFYSTLINLKYKNLNNEKLEKIIDYLNKQKLALQTSNNYIEKSL